MPEANRDAVACTQCHAQMDVLHVKKYPGRWPVVLIVAGAASCVFLISAVIGIPMLLLGIYMATARETISCCPSCGHYFRVWQRERESV